VFSTKGMKELRGSAISCMHEWEGGGGCTRA
jgi:hypothetical protein